MVNVQYAPDRYGIETGAKRFMIPHDEGQLVFDSIPTTRGTYITAGEELASRNLRAPSSRETVALLHAVYCGSEKFRSTTIAEEVRHSAEEYCFYVPQNLVWVKGNEIDRMGDDRQKSLVPNGVYLIDDPTMKGFQGAFHRETLERDLTREPAPNGVRVSETGTLAFVPSTSYRIGNLPSTAISCDSSLVDGLIHASYKAGGMVGLVDVFEAIGARGVRSHGADLEGASETYIRVPTISVYGDEILFDFKRLERRVGGLTYGIVTETTT